MISRRKFLQGALGFTSAAILPAGVIMPIQPIKVLTPKYFDWYWDGPWPESLVSKLQPLQAEVNKELLDSIIEMGRILDEQDVPQNDRIVWLPSAEGYSNDHLYRKFLEKYHVT